MEAAARAEAREADKETEDTEPPSVRAYRETGEAEATPTLPTLFG